GIAGLGRVDGSWRKRAAQRAQRHRQRRACADLGRHARRLRRARLHDLHTSLEAGRRQRPAPIEESRLVMTTQITMPALSPTMEEGNLAKWHVKAGDKIEPGQVIAEIETDKATMEVEAVDEGVIAEMLVPEGSQGVKVNTPIATLAGEGEAAKPAPKQETKAAPSEAKQQAPEPSSKRAPAAQTVSATP